MTENTRTVAVVKGQLSKFSGIIVTDFPSPQSLVLLLPSKESLENGFIV
jgi:hypothetical protein